MAFIKGKKELSNNSPESQDESKEQSDKIEKLSEKVLDEMVQNPRYSSLLTSANSEELAIKNNARKMIQTELSRLIKIYQKGPELAIDFKLDEKKLVSEIAENLWGFSKVTSLVEDKDVTDILINGHDKVLYKKKDVNIMSNIKFRSTTEFKRFIQNITVRNKVNISDISAQRIFTDKKSNDNFRLRISISSELVNCSDEPKCVIRKHPKIKYTWNELEKNGVITTAQRKYLANIMKENRGMIIGGSPGSCKTTILNNLIDEFPEYIFAECYQESDEMFSYIRPGITFKRVIEPSIEGKVGYSLEDFARFGLVSTIEAMVVGEVKGNEARYVLKGTYTGVPCYLTIHANSAKETLENLVNYIVIATGYEPVMVRKMLLAISTIVYMEKKKVVNILKLTGLDEEGNFRYEEVILNEEAI